MKRVREQTAKVPASKTRKRLNASLSASVCEMMDAVNFKTPLKVAGAEFFNNKEQLSGPEFPESRIASSQLLLLDNSWLEIVQQLQVLTGEEMSADVLELDISQIDTDELLAAVKAKSEVPLARSVRHILYRQFVSLPVCGWDEQGSRFQQKMLMSELSELEACDARGPATRHKKTKADKKEEQEVVQLLQRFRQKPFSLVTFVENVVLRVLAAEFGKRVRGLDTLGQLSNGAHVGVWLPNSVKLDLSAIQARVEEVTHLTLDFQVMSFAGEECQESVATAVEWTSVQLQVFLNTSLNPSTWTTLGEASPDLERLVADFCFRNGMSFTRKRPYVADPEITYLVARTGDAGDLEVQLIAAKS